MTDSYSLYNIGFIKPYEKILRIKQGLNSQIVSDMCLPQLKNHFFNTNTNTYIVDKNNYCQVITTNLRDNNIISSLRKENLIKSHSNSSNRQ